MTRWTRAILLFALGSLGGCGLTPRHTVLPYPDHAQAGFEPGDKAEIVTLDGREIDMTVEEVTVDGIVGGDETVAYDDIVKLEKRAWQAPRNPCDDGEPLGCSIPLGVMLLSDFHQEYGDRFDASCRQHDFCYRLGHQTYELERADCDAKFLEDMKDQCQGPFDTDPAEWAECRLAAKHLYDSVVRFGEKAFRQDNGRYCEYAGPPRPL